MRSILLCVLLFAPAEHVIAASQAAGPVMDGPEGQRAFDGLTAFYAGKGAPDVTQAVRDLNNTDADRRRVAGMYLLALFQQSLADESNGRSRLQQTPFWGGGARSPARDFRRQLAKVFSSASAEEALAAALWLVNEDPDAEDSIHGGHVLCRIRSPRSEALFKEILTQPHPCPGVLESVLDEVGERKFTELRSAVETLTNNFRSPVRDAARRTASLLGVTAFSDFDPSKAFTPWLDEQIHQIDSMIMTRIPENAIWIRVERINDDQSQAFHHEPTETFGWLLSEDESSIHVLTWHNQEVDFQKARVKIAPEELADTAKMLARQRYERPFQSFSVRGDLTGQFEPKFVSLPEALVAVWCHKREDRQSAAKVLFPLLERTADDRWFGSAVLELIGNGYHHSMLDAFCNDRDYDRTIALAQKLSTPAFDGYSYQPRAKELVSQLPHRRDDFYEFRLPTQKEWSEQRLTISRDDQVRFLASRLRLLNCFQWGQPGGVSYRDPQYATADRKFWWYDDQGQMINPYIELLELRLEIAELPVLIPLLTDENFMLTFSYWRDFHPVRELHRVNFAVANIVDESAHRELSQLNRLRELDAAGQQAHLEKLIAWCRENAGTTRKKLILESLASSRNWRDFEKAAENAVDRKLTDAYPILTRRIPEFPDYEGSIVETCSRLDVPASAVEARTWILSPREATQFWGALILLKHGDVAAAEGLETVERILADDDGTNYYRRAIAPLVALNSERSLKLAAAIVSRPEFQSSWLDSEVILHRLFMAGRPECLDFLVAKIDSEEPMYRMTGEWNGASVDRDLVEGDLAARLAMNWRIDERPYESLAPDNMRREARQMIKIWLKEQFALVTAGTTTELKLPLP